MNAPRWLADERALQALLDAVLDRFDRQSGEQRQRDVLLAATVAVPDLLHSNARADELWHCIEDLQQRGVLKIRSPRLSKRDPYAAPWQDAKLAFAPECEATLRDWLKRPRTLTAVQAWRQAVLQLPAFAEHATWLQERPIMAAGRSASEILAALASAQHFCGPVTLRQLSARLFWGDSKVLDERSELIATLFPHLGIRERAIVVSVWLPERYGGVLFIENQDTYTAACQGHLSVGDLALVYAAGFRTTAGRIRHSDGALLHYARSGAGKAQQAEFESWWFNQSTAPGIHAELYFWGDLDFAGMQILKSLRERFGEVRAWQPGYSPMLTRLQQGGHAREAAQLDVGATGCEYADGYLLPAIRQWGRLDQESI